MPESNGNQSSNRGAAPDSDGHRNVILICLDTVRKDYFDEYCPRLRERSETSFSQCRVASTWSTPSHASIFTGQLPHQHGVHTQQYDFDRIPSEDIFLSQLPHRTVGISANTYASSSFGFDRLFDEFVEFSAGSFFPEGLNVNGFLKELDDESSRRYGTFLKACLEHDHSVKSIANGVIGKVGGLLPKTPFPRIIDDGASAMAHRARGVMGGDEPTFLFINFMDAHTPLRPVRHYDDELYDVANGWSSTALDKWELNIDGKATAAYTENYRSLYRAAIDYLDRVVSELIDDVVASADRETTVVVFADHGHNLGYPDDDGLFDHTSSMSEGLLHTPCEIVNPPEGYPEHVDDYVSQLQLPELLLAIARNEPFPDVERAEIAAETVGASGFGFAYRDIDDETIRYWDRMMRCVYREDRKIVWDSLGGVEVYQLDPSRPCTQTLLPEERVDVTEIEARHFDVPITEYKTSIDAAYDHSIDRQTEKRLEDLGYL